jgi:hypothetical protein
VFRHYGLPDEQVRDFISGKDWCRIARYAESTNCAATATAVSRQSVEALAQMKAVRLSDPRPGLR